METYQKYLDPKVLNKITKLDLKARLIVEGFVTGLHKSPYHGFSVEFAQHREYVPGDDLRHLDWKVYGRNDRLYLKQYEQETNLRAYIMLDTSESMSYKSDELTKLEYASYIASSLAYLINQQQDAVGLVLFDREVSRFIPASSSSAQLKGIFNEIATARALKKTDIGAVFHNAAERITHKGLVIIISDLLDEIQKVPKIMSGLNHFRHRGHDVILFHVLDDFERSFPFQRMTMFEGMEEYPELLIDPRSIRREYLNEVEAFCTGVRRGCLEQKIDYLQVTTDQMLDVALSGYLAMRLARRR